MPDVDPFQSTAESVLADGTVGEVITPNDSQDLPKRYKYILCGATAGPVAVVDAEGTPLTLYVAAGARLGFRPVRIKATGTTATPLIGVVK